MSRRRKPQTRRPGPAPTATDAVKTHVTKILRAYEGEEQAQIASVEAAGGRIVKISFDEPASDTNDCLPWQITDWRTGKQLASGNATLDGDKGLDVSLLIGRHDPNGAWTDIEQIRFGGDGIDVPPTEGVPASLAEVLEEWASTAPAEQVAAFVDWPVDEVLRCVKTGEGEA
jgi:hypothetical protein